MFSMLVDNGRRRQSAAIDDVAYTTCMPIMFDLRKFPLPYPLFPFCLGKFIIKLQIINHKYHPLFPSKVSKLDSLPVFLNFY